VGQNIKFKAHFYLKIHVNLHVMLYTHTGIQCKHEKCTKYAMAIHVYIHEHVGYLII